MLLRCILCTLLSAVVATLMITMVRAQDSSSSKAKKRIIYKEKSYYDFEDVLINGNLRKPDGSFIFRKQETPFSSALNLHRSFIPELKGSATDTR